MAIILQILIQIQVHLTIKVIHIVIIIEIDDLTLTIIGTNEYYNRGSSNKSTRTQQNFTEQSNPNKRANSSTNFTNSQNDSLLLNDVYGKSFSSDTESPTQNNTPDFSSLLSSFMQSDSNSNTSDSNTIPDIETLLKFKKIFERINSKSNEKDPFVNLLYAMKPFMKDSKKVFIDQLAKFMSIGQLLQDFNTFL